LVKEGERDVMVKIMWAIPLWNQGGFCGARNVFRPFNPSMKGKVIVGFSKKLV
jgi:hypothetical protein